MKLASFIENTNWYWGKGDSGRIRTCNHWLVTAEDRRVDPTPYPFGHRVMQANGVDRKATLAVFEPAILGSSQPGRRARIQRLIHLATGSSANLARTKRRPWQDSNLHELVHSAREDAQCTTCDLSTDRWAHQVFSCLSIKACLREVFML